MSSHQQEVKEWFHFPPGTQLDPVSTAEAAAGLPGELPRSSLACLGCLWCNVDSTIHVLQCTTTLQALYREAP